MIQDHGIPFSATATGAGTVSALVTGTTNTLYFVSDIAASSTGTMGTWAVLADSTVLWEGSGAVNYHFSEPLRGGKGKSVSIYANGSTSMYANISGFYLSF